VERGTSSSRAIDPEVGEVLTLLVRGQRDVLGDLLVGSYLFGSAAAGWYEPGTSDVDTVAVLRDEPTDAQLGSLERLHADLVLGMPEWVGRVEAVYVSGQALATSLASPAPAARISPGEPFHRITVDPRWVLDWYPLGAVGVPLHGPPVADVVPSVSHEVYLAAVRRHLLDPGWLQHLDHARTRCYAILTVCRALRACITGTSVSKREGGAWASTIMPAQAPLIQNALAWRAHRPAPRTTVCCPRLRPAV
jgi:hypothetical protein